MAPIINVAEGLLGKPLPTNKWWGNIIHTTAEEMNTKANPGWSNPYAVKLPKEAPYGIQACYSYNYRQLSAITDGVAELYLHDFVNDLTLSATEFAGEAKPTYEIYAFSDFGINVRACLENKEQCLDSALVHGMAFITATYDRLTARIESEYTMEIVDKSVPGKYILQLGGNQTWVVYTGNNGSFALDESGKALVSSGLFSGTVRVAILPSKKATTVYDKYRACHVRGGHVSVESRTQYPVNWETVGKSCKTNGMLHFALPHHLPALKGAITAKSPKAIVLNSATRGKMVAQVATTGKWVLSEPEDELEVDFYPTSKPSAEVVAKVGLLQTLQADIADHWALNKTSWYFNGKQYQKYASQGQEAAQRMPDEAREAPCAVPGHTLDPPLHYETSYGDLHTTFRYMSKFGCLGHLSTGSALFGVWCPIQPADEIMWGQLDGYHIALPHQSRQQESCTSKLSISTTATLTTSHYTPALDNPTTRQSSTPLTFHQSATLLAARQSSSPPTARQT
ncbi:glycoside hydrolase, putative [Phytophthora infestans T30-4]|uniref:Glycoside hydrolase, putative n=1 Tax=Phytophthora infestans (strain T30-4) TaxID=403677 RepID=D0NMA2_PHYIT|nr:glycoside hydrolase, putative [Phytophthora infestans T30-4]EEY60823.1 glycoside hydrolase, putative [Phytophthora infestans T30-4]|eukprot:XP_002899769.1 glycoside hydrolase, putative [Phytophthora infestans T30-4]